MKWKSRHIDTTEMNEAESKAVLYTLTNHELQDAFKKMAKLQGTVLTRGRGLLCICLCICDMIYHLFLVCYT
jgi:hypothetical protein